MVVQGDKNVCRANKCLLKNLPFSNVDIIRTHGQFNNSLNSDLPTKKYLDKLRSLHDLDIFSLNTQSSVNPENNLDNQQIRSQYFSPHSFCKFRNNYRPISLLSVFNRIFEKLMYKRLKSFLNKNDMFFSSQYGFRENCSTQHAILDILNKIQNNIDKRFYSCGIFIDLKKAFDTVDHPILLYKLHHYGIRGIINDWFSSYLSVRMQSTQIGSIVSSKERIV